MDEEIEIIAVMGDQEAFQFAEEIKNHLESKGRIVNGVHQVLFDKPVIGQEITPDGKKITIGGIK